MRRVVLLLILLMSIIPPMSALEGVHVDARGFRLTEWTVEGKNVIGGGSRGAMGESYPLWDWLLGEAWPGSLATETYTISEEGNTITGRLEKGPLLVEKSLKVLDGESALLTVRLTNTGNETFKSEVNWDSFGLGYAMAWAGYLGEPGGESQLWLDDEIHIENENWVRKGAHVKAFGLVDFDEDLIALLFPEEENVALWFEKGSWGTETRAEFGPLSIAPNGSVEYRFEIFVGHIEGLREKYPAIYEKLAPFVEREKFKITFKLPDIPVVGEKANVSVLVTPREQVNESALLRTVVDCRDYLANISSPVYLSGPSEVSIPIEIHDSCRIKATLELEGRVISSASTVMEGFTKGEPLKVVFVWHQHQSPGVWPNGTLHGPWALVHTYEDELKPYYEGGAYYFHAWVLGKYSEIKMTYHLSPSLLWQWNLTNVGWCQSYPSYRCFKPGAPEAERVREAMKLYRELYDRGQIEVLTSYFAHPISGYIAERYGWFDLLDYELSLGKATTEGVLGVDAKGMWLPEMAFSPKLIPLLEKYGIEYTVLDDRCHLKTIYPYSPYHVYAIENSSIKVLFRDHTISDDFAFNNDFRNEDEAREKARKILEEILKVRKADPNAEVVTIAADGENWIIFSPNPGLTARYFEYLLGYLKEAQEKGLIETVTLGEAVKGEPYKNVTPLTTSWLCSWDKWTREKESVQKPMWERAEEVYNLTKTYEETCGRDGTYKKALYGLAQALDSDFYWAEFSYPEHVYAWLNWTEALVRKGLSTCTPPTSIPTTTEGTGEKEGVCGPALIGILALLPLLKKR
ncbi:hypothetical protein [Palaeococcus ferrophilus]|uniref:hypothetical protein n=1 Tax=Palaeococcus ferrophilus TaxID=83868 RepID=UPI0006974D5D|nr:hypothetical protein [Palaeococcus ferrophilus]